MKHTYTYAITDTENLIFSGEASKFEIYSKPEGGTQELITRYQAGRWSFDSHQQRQLFLALFHNNRNAFFRGFKAFQRSLKERPKLYEFTCIRRRFKIKITKIKDNLWDRMYNLFYSK